MFENIQNAPRSESIVIIGPLKSEKILHYINIQKHNMFHYICPEEEQIKELRKHIELLGANNIKLYDCEADELPFYAESIKQVIHNRILSPSLIIELKTINLKQNKAIEFIVEK